MTTHKEALTLALEYMNEYYPSYAKQAAHHHKVSAAIKEALAQPEQEPCKTCNGTGEVETGIGMMVCDECHGTTYTTPPQRKPLTDEQKKELFKEWADARGVWPRLTHEEIFYAGIEAAHGIKGEA